MRQKGDTFRKISPVLLYSIKERYAELEKSHIPGAKSPSKIVAEEFTAELRAENAERTGTGIYQIIRYHLRKDEGYLSDKRIGYKNKELKNILLMSTAERGEYAERTGRSVRALLAAANRYEARMKRELAKVVASNMEQKTKIESELKLNGFIDFCYPPDLKYVGKTRDDVLTARRKLTGHAGLSLRSPNILYHPKTRKCYFMTTGEQLSLLENPIKFLKSRAEHIRQNWVDRDTDIEPDDKPVEKAFDPKDPSTYVDLT